MSSEDTKGIIVLDDKKVKCLIFKVNLNDTTQILSTSITPSEGIHKGRLVNLTKATKTIRYCISSAEKKANTSLKKINVVLEEPEFLCTKFSKHKKIDGSKIHKEDIEFLLKEAKKELMHNDDKQIIVHIFNHNYLVDNKVFVEEPIDVYADFLSHEMTFITMPNNNYKNLNQAFIDCDIEIERIISNTFGLGVNLLNDKELENGSIIIDLGFEKTSMGVFKNFAMVNSITLPIGVNHITKDVSKVCAIKIEESEKIIKNFDFSFNDNNAFFDEKNYLKESYFVGTSFRKISKNLIIEIIQSRLNEIFIKLRKQIVIPELNSKLGFNFILTGSESNLLNLDKYCENFFKLNARKIIEKESNNKDLGKDFASCLGVLKIIKDGWETEAIPKIDKKSVRKMGFLQKIFRL